MMMTNETVFKAIKNRELSNPIRTLGMVRITGLEPARLSPHEPESCASANSAISAEQYYYTIRS